VDALRESVEPKVRWKRPSVVILAVRVHMGLEESDGVGVFGVLHSPEEDATTGPVSVVVLHLSLKAEEQQI
jgi:hypothetical protein